MKTVFDGMDKEILKLRKKMTQPTFVKPMLATLTEDYFSSKDWLYEHKFDGERCLAFKKNGKVTLKSRNNNSMNVSYPEIVTALVQQSANNFIIDGEIVAVSKKGMSDFESLQSRIHVLDISKVKEKEELVHVAYCIFDILYVDGYDICKLPLLDRKKILKKLLKYNNFLIYTEHRIGDGLSFFKKACALHWEGIIAKRCESLYVNKRSSDWLKFKCIMQQELIIVGYTEPKGSRKYFGALLVGYYDHDKLMYAGKVGTGYTEETLEMIGKKLKKIEIATCPLNDYDESKKGAHWVKPVLVAEFRFAQWTKAGRLRVGRYKGLRDDKKAQDVVRESPKSIIHR